MATTTTAEKAAAVEEKQKEVRPPPDIRTAEDAYNAFLREEINETELRAAVSSLGGSPFYVLRGNLERPDNAYLRTVPEDMYVDPTIVATTVEERLAVVHARQEAADEATKQAELEKELA